MSTVVRRAGPKRRRWTSKEFYPLLDLGFFLDQRVELIEGEILVMSAQKNLHPLSIKLTEDSLNVAFGVGYWVRVQMSLDLTPFSVPDPDLAVVEGSPRDHNTPDNPTSALLIAEVSETTLRYDRGRKASLYARVNIADYWIVNLVQRQLEVYRNPVPDGNQAYGFGYADVMVLGPNDYVSPLAAPQARIAVADFLP
jgi:Uma2 family endonuclease